MLCVYRNLLRECVYIYINNIHVHITYNRSTYERAVEWYIDNARDEMVASGSTARFPVRLWQRVEMSSGGRSLEFRSSVVHDAQSSTVDVLERGVDGRCDACGGERASYRCSGCRMTRYCSRECQVAHWPTHRDNCLQRRRNDLNDSRGAES